MPKDNEVDEKAEDFFERLYGMTFRLFLDPNSEEDEGNTVELRLGATVDNLALFETQDHAVLYSAATVAELRAEVERARVAGIDACEKLTMLWQKDIDRADAAERRVGELEVALRNLRDAFVFRQAIVASADTIEKIDFADSKAWKACDEAKAALTGADPT